MTPPASSSSASGPLPGPVTVHIRADADVACAQSAVRAYAARCGLSARAQCEVTIAASEAATNMLKYAGGGELHLTALPDGLAFEALDRGPGIPDLAVALRDGVSQGERAADAIPSGRRKGLGLGLGAIYRLMHDVHVRARPGGGTALRAVRRRT